jgi:imidazole glycerol phosphate synthase subunit HisF
VKALSLSQKPTKFLRTARKREFTDMLKVTIVAATALVIMAVPAAAELAKRDAIKAAISGNTVQGNMDSTGPYAEHYGADGVVHGKDYKAQWSVEADTMCWVYEGTPKDCWGAEIAGDQVKWVKDGKAQGSGTILSGNPNKF